MDRVLTGVETGCSDAELWKALEREINRINETGQQVRKIDFGVDYIRFVRTLVYMASCKNT